MDVREEDDKENVINEMTAECNDSKSMTNGLAATVASHEQSLSTPTNSASVKRSNEDEENGKPDLKKIRVFPSVSMDGVKVKVKIFLFSLAVKFDLLSCVCTMFCMSIKIVRHPRVA